VPRQGCLEEDAHELGPAPLASEPSVVGQSRAGSSRGVLLGCYFLLLLLMVIITVPVRRFSFESRCSLLRRVCPHRRPGCFPRRRWPRRRPLLGRGENKTLSRFALSSAPPSNRPIRPKKCPNPLMFHTRSPLHLPGTLLSNGPCTKPPQKPRLAGLGKHPQLTGKREVGPGSSQSARPKIKSARPKSWDHPEQIPTSKDTRTIAVRGAKRQKLNRSIFA
jgi:hypothetical protein